MRLRVALAVVVPPLVLAGLLYAPLFGGFWLGDDAANLHRVYALAQQHRLFAESAQLFVYAPPSASAFYRPLVMASFAANYALADARYAGWFAINLAVHLANVGLIAAVVLRLGRRLGCDARIAALAAALLFGAAPVPAEAVYWVSARSDGWVVLFSLAAMLAWAGERSPADRGALALPFMLVLALGFKESAAVLPLQMALVAIAWPSPRPRSQWVALAAAFAILAAWFALRAFLFGSVWHVYGGAGSDVGATLRTFGEGLKSIPAWWHAQTAPHDAIALVYAAAIAVAAIAVAMGCRGERARMAAALVAASGGLMLATLLNVGLHASGEGGRNFYAPSAWLALAAGVALARPVHRANETARSLALACIAAAALAGTVLLHFKVEQVLSASRQVRAFAAALDPWAAAHPGLTMIIAPEMDGSIVTLRNAQGAMALPPIQPRPLLHRTLPTLPSEIGLRHEQFEHGLASRLATIAPARVDASVLAALGERDAPRWPAAACWSANEQRLMPLPETDPADARRWSESLLASTSACFAPSSGSRR